MGLVFHKRPLADKTLKRVKTLKHVLPADAALAEEEAVVWNEGYYSLEIDEFVEVPFDGVAAVVVGGDEDYYGDGHP